MPAGPVLLVLVSAFLHALWNALLKKQEQPAAAAVGVAGVAALAAAAITPVAAGSSFPRLEGLVWGVAAGLLEGGYFATLTLAFQHGSLAQAYSVSRGGAIALVWPVSVLALGEPVTPAGVSGAVLVGAGLLLFGLDRTRASARGNHGWRGIGWALGCAACIASYHLCYKSALLVSAQPAALSAVSLLVALPVSVLLLGRGGLARVLATVRARPLPILLTGLVCAASFVIFLLALASGGAGAVLTLRNTSVLFALAFSRAIGERPRRQEVAGGLLVVLGATFVGWPAR